MKLAAILGAVVMVGTSLQSHAEPQYYFGADLSYVNEMEDCGAVYRDAAGVRADPFQLLQSRGANLVRVRLWNDARWTRYSNMADVKKTIRRARKAGMQVLLDYHYSDDWADGDKQIIPAAWAADIDNPDKLAERVHEFTLSTLRELDAVGLMPELVQVGNETNGEILSTLERAKNPIDWTRNAKLFNAGIRAVREAGATSRIKPRVMLHIAQPENVEPWFAAAAKAGVSDFDMIGISYYRRWSTQDLDGLSAVINRLRQRHAADVLLVEAAYPWTLDHKDEMPNLLGTDTLIQDYPATRQGQRRYLIDLTQRVIASGGVGMVYWEPAWVSSRCKTRWGTGSSWENAALFDFDGRLLPGADYLDFPYVLPVDVEFALDVRNVKDALALYLWSDVFESSTPVTMKLTDGKAHANLRLMPGTRMKLQVYRDAQRQQPLLSADDAPGRFVQAVAGADDTTISLTEKLCDQCVVAQAKSTLGNFNGNWQFHRAADVDADVKSIPSSQWVEVTVPHTARIEPRIVNDQWQGIAFYRKAFAAEPSWRGKQVWLRFEGAMNVAEVRFNGRVVTTHLGGYLPFVVDLTKGLKFDAANELVVRLDNRDNAVTGPKPLKVLDFNMYGGLYRDVSLIVKSPVHITDEIMEAQPGGGGIFVTYPAVSRDKATVAVKTHLRNTSRAKASFRIVQALSKDGREVARHVSTSTTLAAGANVSVAQQFDVGQPSLWSPRSPSLYQLRTIVETSEGTVDERHTRIGIRRIDIAPGKFAINGEATFLRGVNRHQEYPYVGYALSPEADYRDAKRIKEAGFDFVRLSHYPHSSHFMAAADELGLVLLDSIPGWQFFNPDPAFERQVLQTCRDMIRRDRNHPSVIAWECSLNETQMPTSLVQRFNEIVHEEYPGDQAYSAGWQDDGYDVYIQARQHRIEHYEPPKRPYLVSEYGDWEYYALNAGFQQHTWANLKEEDRTSRQLLGAGEARLLQQALNNQEAHNDNFSTPAFADAYWVMFDYNRGYAEDLEASGVMSLERLPKFNYQFFRTQRAADEVSPRFEAGPAVFIASYWLPDSSTRVRVFGNVDEVQLFLNGRSVARQRPDRDRVSDRLRHPPFTFDVGKYEAGTLDAVGYRNGRAIALHRVITPEAPERLQIEIDDAGVCSATDAADLVFARARVLDRNGAAVPADRSVQFSAAGSAELVGEKDQRAEAGIASALLRVSRTTAHANVFASSGPLTAQQIWLRPACISAIP